VGIVTAIAAALTAVSVDLASSPANFAMVAIWNGGAGLAIFLGVAFLVRKLRVERDAMRAAATHDGLTGLPNRVLLYDRLEQALLAAAREKFSVGVLVFDLDGLRRSTTRWVITPATSYCDWSHRAPAAAFVPPTRVRGPAATSL
jgi:predicted signal transduction protein with EAL and GGDEF domain